MPGLQVDIFYYSLSVYWIWQRNMYAPLLQERNILDYG